MRIAPIRSRASPRCAGSPLRSPIKHTSNLVSRCLTGTYGKRSAAPVVSLKWSFHSGLTEAGQGQRTTNVVARRQWADENADQIDLRQRASPTAHCLPRGLRAQKLARLQPVREDDVKGKALDRAGPHVRVLRGGHVRVRRDDALAVSSTLCMAMRVGEMVGQRRVRRHTYVPKVAAGAGRSSIVA